MRLKGGPPVRFVLNQEGRQAFRDIFPGDAPIQAHVLEDDEDGVWILVGEKETGESETVAPAMLLKWEYVATAWFDYGRKEPEEILRIGTIRPES